MGRGRVWCSVHMEVRAAYRSWFFLSCGFHESHPDCHARPPFIDGVMGTVLCMLDPEGMLLWSQDLSATRAKTTWLVLGGTLVSLGCREPLWFMRCCKGPQDGLSGNKADILFMSPGSSGKWTQGKRGGTGGLGKTPEPFPEKASWRPELLH